MIEKVARIFKEFEHKRAPQFASRSQSPYLLANSFNFDVTEILAEVKKAKDQDNLKAKLESLSKYDLEVLLEKKAGINDRRLNMLARKSDSGQDFFKNIEVTDDMIEMINKILKTRDEEEQ